MRIDKFLWCVRYYKTRNMVTEAAKKNHITVNGNVAKPSKEVFPGDKITFRKDQITHIVSVLDLPQSRVGAKLVDIYRKDETPAESFAHMEMIRLSKEHYRKNGEGRPTKKDRRDIDGYTGDFDEADESDS
ncbi:S4 domain-containing protein [Flavobacterium sp.]|uniref:RNA-binding S4 domain-containing protein n=1 Tax=Flavobacterium sp. TaxID=239 RepID=UPI0011FD0A89|nr:S4 domain-containing protein [Flavobacterium sp.]RZJ71709.1 MAG: RNA-binding S4 domain-containing protein [Flavobacterium sp.]